MTVSVPQKRGSAKRRFTIRKKDAFDALATLETKSIDLICTSPPYWGHRAYDQDHDESILDQWRAEEKDGAIPSYDWYRKRGGVLGLEPYPEWYISHLVEIFEIARPALKPTGSMWLNLGDTYFGRWSSIRPNGRQGLAGKGRVRRRTPSGGWLHDKQLLLIPARLAIALQDAGWILRNDLIWSKPNVPPRPEQDRLRLSHEHLFHFVQRTKGGRPSYFYDLEKTEPGSLDVVSVRSSKTPGIHPAVFPSDLIKPRIASSCPKGGTVLDPFCGSGTTLAAAIELGRKAVGFDVSDAYIREARAKVGGASRA